MKTNNPLKTVALYAFCLIGSLPFTATAEDWPEFRGPGGQGHSQAKQVPIKWSTDKNVAWKSNIPGTAWSSPILIGDKLYLTTAIPEGKKNYTLHALAVNAQDGKILWDVEVIGKQKGKPARMHKKNSHASPTPIFEDGKVYVHFGHDGTACLNAADGKTLWKVDIKYNPVHGNGGSPVLVDDLLIFSCDGKDNPFIIALDKNTGKTVWKTPRAVEVSRHFSFTTPLLIEVNGQRQLISPASGAVIAYDPSNGKEIWRCGYGEGYSVVARPLYANGLIYVSTGFNKAKLMAIRAEGKGDVTKTHIAWEYEKAVPKESSPIIVDDYLYMNDDKGLATCLDAKTGKLIWEGRLTKKNYSAAPIYAGGLIYFHDGEGMTTVIKPGKKLDIVARNDIGEHGLSSFAVTDGALFIRTDSALFRIGKP
ncbi:MAG: PQQ-binding-like beta-propeller repeat protein [Verrucomicrobiales bacterium]|nr:PQQ-binding-like beta-propeller repeat protein [Verrucomicrobiales bacterium]